MVYVPRVTGSPPTPLNPWAVAALIGACFPFFPLISFRQTGSASLKVSAFERSMQTWGPDVPQLAACALLGALVIIAVLVWRNYERSAKQVQFRGLLLLVLLAETTALGVVAWQAQPITDVTSNLPPRMREAPLPR